MYLYFVRLPEHLQTIHLVFHISQLEPSDYCIIPNHTNLPSPSIEINGKLEFKVAEILDSKWDHRQKDLLWYYVRWVGYKSIPEEYLWLSMLNLKNTAKLLFDYHSQNLTKPGPCNSPTLLQELQSCQETTQRQSITLKLIDSHRSQCEGDWSGVLLQEIPQLNYSIEYVTTHLQEIPQRIR